jgi:Rrf2 family transcriptional regulator, nitric oxide-sensitive transcriptional repressor
MRPKRYTEYALRVLMHLAAKPEQLSSIGEISREHSISHNHLMKIVHNLRKDGFIEALRGRNGGIRLSRAGSEITVGEVVRATEGGFDAADGAARQPECPLDAVVQDALRAFISTLDEYRIADLVDSARNQ